MKKVVDSLLWGLKGGSWEHLVTQGVTNGWSRSFRELESEMLLVAAILWQERVFFFSAASTC